MQASQLRPYFWTHEALAEVVKEALDEPWLEADALAGTYDGEPAVCFKHPARCDVYCRVMNGDPVTHDELRYYVAAELALDRS